MSGFIGQELMASFQPHNAFSKLTTTTTTTTTTIATAVTTADADAVAAATTYYPLDRSAVAQDGHNALLVGVLIGIVVAAITLGGLTSYWLRRRARRQLQRVYQARLQRCTQARNVEGAGKPGGVQGQDGVEVGICTKS